MTRLPKDKKGKSNRSIYLMFISLVIATCFVVTFLFADYALYAPPDWEEKEIEERAHVVWDVRTITS